MVDGGSLTATVGVADSDSTTEGTSSKLITSVSPSDVVAVGVAALSAGTTPHDGQLPASLSLLRFLAASADSLKQESASLHLCLVDPLPAPQISATQPSTQPLLKHPTGHLQ
jgi:hypothetical protein